MAKNNVWQWDENAANNTDIAGIDVSGATGKVKDGDNVMRAMAAQIITMEGKGSDVASAATITLGTERYYHITGTTTITDIDFTDAVDGRWVWLVFDGALTLTHNGTTLKLPGNANIVTAAGDRALFVQDGTDNVICLVYQRATGTPITTGTFTPTFSASGATFSYAAQDGSYLKIGQLVFFSLRISLNTSGNTLTANPLSVEGLPFTSANPMATARFPVLWSGATNAHVYAISALAQNSTSLTIAGGTAAMTNVNLINSNSILNATAGSGIGISGCYIAA